jgi:FtsH-binding integral membrane protein
MPEAVESGTSDRSRRLTLNTDGRRHPVQNGLTAFTFLAGLVALATGFVVHLHSVASICGAAALVVGLFAQLISATREERIFIVAGIIAAFVGLALGIAHGGFV